MAGDNCGRHRPARPGPGHRGSIGPGCGDARPGWAAVSSRTSPRQSPRWSVWGDIPPDATRTRIYEGSYDGYLLAKQKLLALEDELASARRRALSV